MQHFGTYKKMLEKRKEKVVNEISILTANMSPINYMNKKRELEKFIEINSKDLEDKEKIIIKLQEEFIKALKDNCYLFGKRFISTKILIIFLQFRIINNIF